MRMAPEARTPNDTQIPPEDLHREKEATIQPILAIPSFCVFFSSSSWNLPEALIRKSAIRA